MKKIIFVLFFLALAFMHFSCKKVQKNVYDYYPTVKTVSATVQPDGSVQVKGEVVSSGAGQLEYLGFCMGTMPVPKMSDNQALSNTIQGSEYTASYSGFSTGTRYYFRAWATNGNGYSYGNIIYLDSVVTAPVVAPCSPPMNSINIGGGNPTETYFSVGTPSTGGFSSEFQAESNSTTVDFQFGEVPKTKIYTTTSSTSPGPNQVNIGFYSGFISGELSDGVSVYVNQTGSTWVITICNAPWIYNSSTFNFTTKFTCPL